jgi:hypothetical protein
MSIKDCPSFDRKSRLHSLLGNTDLYLQRKMTASPPIFSTNTIAGKTRCIHLCMPFLLGKALEVQDASYAQQEDQQCVQKNLILALRGLTLMTRQNSRKSSLRTQIHMSAKSSSLVVAPKQAPQKSRSKFA